MKTSETINMIMEMMIEPTDGYWTDNVFYSSSFAHKYYTVILKKINSGEYSQHPEMIWSSNERPCDSEEP